MLFFIKLLIVYILSNIINLYIYVSLIITVLLSVAFFTLLERKVLSSLQRRRGPNVVGFYGSLQAIADGLKLLNKENITPLMSNHIVFFFSPLLTFSISFMLWAFIPFNSGLVNIDIDLSLLYFFAISSLNIYGIILGGWGSNSKYSFLGGLRSSAQFISYEISLGLIILPIILYTGSTNLVDIVNGQENMFYIWVFPLLFLLCFISLLAETNRIPFDLPEAESELVSGYNVEYASVLFVLYFLAEYSNIIVMSCLLVCLFFGGWLNPFFFFFLVPSHFWFFFKTLIIMYLFVFIRGILPRYRYDQLMMLGWKVILPVSFVLSVFSIFLFYVFI